MLRKFSTQSQEKMYRQHQSMNLVSVTTLLLVVMIGSSSLLSGVNSYRADFISSLPLAGAVMVRPQPAHMLQQQQGCVWSPLNGNNVNGENSTAVLPPFLQQRTARLANSFSLDCQVRTLGTDFQNLTREQVDTTSRLYVKCNEKLYFESTLDPSQSFFRLRNLQDIHIDSCKIRKIPNRIWASLGFLKTLKISSFNNQWSPSVGMDIEMGTFEGLTNLERLELDHNNIWLFPDKNIFCPLRSLLKLNVSHNKITDLEDLGFGSSFRVSSGNEEGSCVMNIQNLDLSHNSLRRIPNAFNRVRKLSALFLQNNLIEEIEDNSFSGLSQLRLLNMSSNKIVALPPAIFRSTPSLREINLSNNSLSALSPQIFPPNLISLDISGNALTSQWITGNMFQGLQSLIVLKINSNQLSYIDSQIFSNLLSLQALHLQWNRIENINPSAFSSLSSLHILDLSHNRLTLIDSRHFSNLFMMRQLSLDHNLINAIDSDAFHNVSNLQDMGLSGNKLSEVPVGIRGLRHLVTLDIGENEITSITNESFSGLGQLYGLRLVDNKLKELESGFCDPLNKLRVLNVAQNRIRQIQSGAFVGCPDLRALRLDNNALEELPTLLSPELPQLLWLNVSENKLKWADYRLLPQSVEWLDVSHNQIEILGGPNNGGGDVATFSLRVLDASHNKIQSLDYTTIAPKLETLRLNHCRLKKVAPETFSRSGRLRRVELIGNLLENLPLSALRFPPVPSGKPVPEFYIGGNPFVCDCSMEWLQRVNQLTLLRQHPRIVDLDAIVCRPTFSRRSNQLVPLVETKPSDFLCAYTEHCFALCECCDFDYCDCRQKCPTNCTCYHDTTWGKNTVDCSSQNSVEIPSNIPMDSSEIYLDGNNFGSLSSHVFIGKKNLRILFLNNSEIVTIKNKTFNGLQHSLEILHLNGNKLRELNGFEFADLQSLREVYLHNNLIRFIEKDTFSKLSLNVLRLDGNQLVNFPVWELGGYLNSVALANNPWSCDCKFLIPFRTWAATKFVTDILKTTCQPLTVGSNSTEAFGDDSSSSQDINHNGQLIINMCDHNKEINFNFNSNDNDNIPALLNNEILNSNHISAEKVASEDNGNTVNNNHNNYYPSFNDISSSAAAEVDKESSELWTIFTSVLITLLIVLVIVLFLLFGKGHSLLLPQWIWLSSCGNDDDSDNEASACHNNRSSFLPTIFYCCCSRRVGHQSKKSIDHSDKLFDAYLLYSRHDEDLLQKLSPELESPSTSGYSSAGTLSRTGNRYYRLCLHFRDLPFSTENPVMVQEMVLSAIEASKSVVIFVSRAFLQNEMTHPGFRAAIQIAITRFPSKIIFVLLPPFTEQNLVTIYPELKAGHFSPMSEASSTSGNNNGGGNQIASVDWTDKNFLSKLKLLLPTPHVSNISSPSGLNSTSTISSTGSSLFNVAHPHPNLINCNNSLSLHEYAYNTINSQQQQHHYHRNILPFQQLGNANTPPVPKHHVALSAQSWQQHQQQLQNQNFYNNSQHSQIIPIPGYPTATVTGGNASAGMPLIVPNSFQQPNNNIPSFNESFRRHLQLQQNQNKVMMANNNGTVNHQHHHSSCSGSSQSRLPGHNNHSHLPHHPHHPHNHHHQGSHCSSSHSHTSSTSNNNPVHPYQPLDANYSSSSSNEELLDHVYSTLDSTCDSTEMITSNVNGCSAGGKEEVAKASNENNVVPQQQNRLNNNDNSNNCSGINNPSGNNNGPSKNSNNNGTMYFV